MLAAWPALLLSTALRMLLVLVLALLDTPFEVTSWSGDEWSNFDQGRLSTRISQSEMTSGHCI
jgi:hypothetical protein